MFGSDGWWAGVTLLIPVIWLVSGLVVQGVLGAYDDLDIEAFESGVYRGASAEPVGFGDAAILIGCVVAGIVLMGVASWWWYWARMLFLASLYSTALTVLSVVTDPLWVIRSGDPGALGALAASAAPFGAARGRDVHDPSDAGDGAAGAGPSRPRWFSPMGPVVAAALVAAFMLGQVAWIVVGVLLLVALVFRRHRRVVPMAIVLTLVGGAAFIALFWVGYVLFIVGVALFAG
ncbi:hypothetical protein IA539_21650 [Gordonia sp. zg691]|nr:hypothetical protein [Gordonia jinghuaiqii]